MLSIKSEMDQLYKAEQARKEELIRQVQYDCEQMWGEAYAPMTHMEESNIRLGRALGELKAMGVNLQDMPIADKFKKELTNLEVGK